MKKVLTTIILLLLVGSMLLVGCEKAPAPLQDTDAPTSETDAGGEVDYTDYVSLINEWLPQKNFGSEIGGKPSPRQVTLLTFWDYNKNYHFFANEENGDALNRVTMERTNYINTLYNVDLVCVEDNHLKQTLDNSLRAGGGEYDLFYPHPSSELPAMVIEGSFENLYDYKYLNFDQPWWNQNQVQNYTINNRLNIAVSDFSMSGQGFCSILFNKEIYEALGQKEDLYELVYDGEWTLDHLMTLSKMYGGNAESATDPNAQYGFVFNGFHSSALMYGAGQRIVNRTENSFEIALSHERLNNIAQKMHDLIWGGGKHILTGTANYGQTEQSDMLKAFKAGQALFMSYDIGALYRYLIPGTDSDGLDFNVGYLPMPKYDTEQKDYYVSTAAGFFCIPAFPADGEMSSILLEALSIYSYVEYRPEFYRTILTRKMAADQADYDMLDFLHSQKTYDLGYTFDTTGIAIDVLLTVVYNDKSTNTSGYLRANNRSVQEILSNIQKVGEN